MPKKFKKFSKFCGKKFFSDELITKKRPTPKFLHFSRKTAFFAKIGQNRDFAYIYL